MSNQETRDPGTRWGFRVYGPDKITTIAFGSTVDEVRGRARGLLREGYDRATIRFSPSQAVEIEFDLLNPKAIDALRIRFLPHGDHLSGPNIAHILDVERSTLHAALKPLVDRQMLEIMNQGEVSETWVLGLQMRDLGELLELAKRLGITLDAPLRRRVPS